MTSVDRTLLTFGVVLIVIVVAIVLAITVMGWGPFIPFVLVLFGAVALGLAAAKKIQPLKYEYGAFNTAAFGVCLIALGGAWYLFAYNWIYSVIVLLLAVAALAIVAAIRRK
jgi:hypothetical protein